MMIRRELRWSVPFLVLVIIGAWSLLVAGADDGMKKEPGMTSDRLA